jgi:myosin III
VYASQLGFPKPSVLKMPFKFRDIPFFDTTAMCNLLRPSQSTPVTITGEEMDEPWDAPFHRKNMVEYDYGGRRSRGYGHMHDDDVIVNHMYSRDPNYSMR